jgi:hypothetical protein
MTPVLFWISDLYMRIAAMILNEKVAWPQINFMSAYPDDVRNGYLLFVLATFTTVLLSSGIIAGLLGASVGKRVLGIRYHIFNSDKPAGSLFTGRPAGRNGATFSAGRGTIQQHKRPYLGHAQSRSAACHSC